MGHVQCRSNFFCCSMTQKFNIRCCRCRSLQVVRGHMIPPKGMVRAKERTSPSHSHSNCLTGANRTCPMVNRFAMHIIRIVAPLQKMASDANEGFMYAGSASNPNRTRSVHMSDYQTVPHVSLFQPRLPKFQFLSRLRS